MLRLERRKIIGLTGIAGTVLLHSFLFAVAVWEGGATMSHPRPPDAVGGGANVGSESGEPGERRITVMLTNEFQSARAFEPPPKLPEPAIVQPSVVEVTGLDMLPLEPIESDALGENESVQKAELMARVKFAGIYQSQVRARIERAWQLPAGQKLEPDFSCLVLIHQDSDGRVREVELVLSKCVGSPEMQTSLVNAIQTASPLPAPPHPSVFVDRFSLFLDASDRAVMKNIRQQ